MFQRATLGQRAEKEERGALIRLDGCSQVAFWARELICLCLHSVPEAGRTSLLQYHGYSFHRLARGLRMPQYSYENIWLSLMILFDRISITIMSMCVKLSSFMHSICYFFHFSTLKIFSLWTALTVKVYVLTLKWIATIINLTAIFQLLTVILFSLHITIALLYKPHPTTCVCF